MFFLCYWNKGLFKYFISTLSGLSFPKPKIGMEIRRIKIIALLFFIQSSLSGMYLGHIWNNY